MKNEFDKKSTQILIFTTILFFFHLIINGGLSSDVNTIRLTFNVFISIIVLLICIIIFVISIKRLNLYFNEIQKTNRNATAWRIYATLVYSVLILFSYIIIIITII